MLLPLMWLLVTNYRRTLKMQLRKPMLVKPKSHSCLPLNNVSLDTIPIIVSECERVLKRILYVNAKDAHDWASERAKAASRTLTGAKTNETNVRWKSKPQPIPGSKWMVVLALPVTYEWKILWPERKLMKPTFVGNVNHRRFSDQSEWLS